MPAVVASLALLFICATCLWVALTEEPTHGPCQAVAPAGDGIEVWVRHPFTLRICVLKMLPSEPLHAATAKLFGNALPERSQMILDGRIIPASTEVRELSSSCVVRFCATPLLGGAKQMQLDTLENAQQWVEDNKEFLKVHVASQYDAMRALLDLRAKPPQRGDINEWRKLATRWRVGRKPLETMKAEIEMKFLCAARSALQEFIQTHTDRSPLHAPCTWVYSGVLTASVKLTIRGPGLALVLCLSCQEHRSIKRSWCQGLA